MLTKNVYLLYPPGYSGSYINWAISISDLDTKSSTVANPINSATSEKFGGHGTTHHHVRIPTHQTITEHVNWVLHNRPTSPKIYIINSTGLGTVGSILQLVHHDPTGIFIDIHDDNNSIVNSYGLINCVTKWPTYFVAHAAVNDNQLPFDPFNCGQDLTFRNWIINNKFLDSCPPSDDLLLKKTIQARQEWFNVRNRYQPHEVNEKTYITNVSLDNRIFKLSCYDIVTPGFLDIFKNIIVKSKISDNYDLTFFNQFHQNYIDAQPNLQWFDSIQRWKSTGQLDTYLTSHSIIEACLIKEIFKNLKLDQIEINNRDWGYFYTNVKDSNWPECKNEWDFYKLPDPIQTELITAFDYSPRTPVEFSLLELKNNWINMNLYEINESYQQLVKLM
jgi:hypothetical protein